MHDNDIIVVIGMGRSGTALTCQVLEALGVSFGKPEHLIGPSPFNERGHYDHGPIHNLNIELLERCFNVPWLFLGELPRNWHKWDSVYPYKMQAADVLREELAYARKASPLGLFGIKDPRITRMRRFWEDVFEMACLRPRYILCWRHPEHVYMSSHPKTLRPMGEKQPGQKEEMNVFDFPHHPTIHRQDMYAIWAHYMAEGIDAKPEAVIKYDNWFLLGHAEKQCEMLARTVGADPLSTERLGEIIDPSMRHYGT